MSDDWDWDWDDLDSQGYEDYLSIGEPNENYWEQLEDRSYSQPLSGEEYYVDNMETIRHLKKEHRSDANQRIRNNKKLDYKNIRSFKGGMWIVDPKKKKKLFKTQHFLIFDFIGSIFFKDEIIRTGFLLTPKEELKKNHKLPILRIKASDSSQKILIEEGALWKSKYRNTPKSPDVRGKIGINGEKYRIVGWNNSLEYLRKNPKSPLLYLLFSLDSDYQLDSDIPF
tara:strand:- start:127 stop:804 length:678 start_codon:yes stop_codon:yes gene_type:complete